jgi:nitrate/nitrite transporter NarK
MQAVQTLGLAAISLLAGLIVDQYGYLWLEVFFIFWLVLATVATIVLWLVDLHYNDRYLNMTAKERKIFDEQIRARHLEDEIKLLSSEIDDIRIY